MLALTLHDREICPSGAGPLHYIDQCDGDTSDIEPEPVERVCVYLKAFDDWRDDRAQDKHPEKGVLVSLTDTSKAGAHSS